MIFCCAVASMALALILHRRAAGWSAMARPRFGDFAAAFAALWLFALFLPLAARPILAALLCALAALGLWACNEAKKKCLRGEPLVFSDAALLVQVCRFPSLYLPFLPVGKMLAGLAAGCAVGLWLWQWETPLAPPPSWWPSLLPFALITMLPFMRHSSFGANRLANLLDLAFDPAADALKHGPLGAAALHICWHLTLRGNWGRGVIHVMHSPHPRLAWPREALQATAKEAEKPDIFLVQAESFCDPRLNPHVPPDILAHYDALRREATHGTLRAKTFGAYTMRAEFSVLTGIPAQALGTDAFNPYLAASRAPLWSLARHLREHGYRTMCIHPFAPSFFLRNKVMPNMGFERFITADSFSFAQKFGPHISDAAVALAMLDALMQSGQPLFCFAITMEAHGPWLKGRFSAEEKKLLPRFSPNLSQQERFYLAHLQNADAMIAALSGALRARQRPALLGWYGDHPPGLTRLVEPEASGTPYFVWRARKGEERREDIVPEDLGGLLLNASELLTAAH